MTDASEAVLSRIREITTEIRELERTRRLLEVEWAVQVCPFKVGDKTVCCSYGYRGKPCVIKRIYMYAWWKDRFMWAVECCILSKSGDEGRLTAIFHQGQYENWLAR